MRSTVTGVPTTTYSCAPISQTTPLASLSYPSISILTPSGVVPRSTPASMASAPDLRWRSSEPDNTEINWSADNLLIKEPAPDAVASEDKL